MNWKRILRVALLGVVIYLLVISCGSSNGNNDDNNANNLYTVTFATNGGTAVTGHWSGLNRLVSLPATIRSGYDFSGWFTDNGTFAHRVTASESSPYRLTHNLTLYAKWEAVGEGPFKVTFMLDGGGGTDNLENVTGYITEPLPTKTGYIFGGWFDNAELTGYMEIFPFKVTKNTTFYARWVPVPGFTVTFNSLGGSYVPAMNNAARVVVQPASGRFGFIFNGWLDNTGSVVHFPYAVKGNIALTAIWTEEIHGCELSPRWRILLGYFLNG